MKKFYSILIMLVICAALLLSCESSPATITVTLKANYEGGATNTETTTSDTYYYPSWEPSRDGYYLTGWAYNAEGTQKYEDTKLTKNTTLYAVWEKKGELVTVNCTVDLSALTLQKGDLVKATATSGTITSSKSVRVKEPSLAKQWKTLFLVSDKAGDITVEVSRDSSTIGKGYKEVEKFVEGETYTVTVAAVN